MYELQAEMKGLKLELEVEASVPEVLHSDSRRVKQIIINLLSNAFKFTFSGSIKILGYYQSHKNMMIVEVRDSGIGISLVD